MVSRYSERLQELEREITGRLNELGIVNIRIYFPENPSSEDRPYIRYKLKRPFKDCKNFRKRIGGFITTNFSGKIKSLNWGRNSEMLEKEHKVYLNLENVKIENSEAMNHGLLSLINQELINYEMRK